MNVHRIGFLGRRTTNYRQTADFFQDILGLQSVWTKPDWSGFRLPAGKNDPKLFPDSSSGPLVAFIVDDVVGVTAMVMNGRRTGWTVSCPSRADAARDNQARSAGCPC